MALAKPRAPLAGCGLEGVVQITRLPIGATSLHSASHSAAITRCARARRSSTIGQAPHRKRVEGADDFAGANSPLRRPQMKSGSSTAAVSPCLLRHGVPAWRMRQRKAIVLINVLAVAKNDGRVPPNRVSRTPAIRRARFPRLEVCEGIPELRSPAKPPTVAPPRSYDKLPAGPYR
jgi:hypothetical protein